MNLSVQSLSVERLAEAYPLVRTATRVSQERWDEFGRALLESGGGVLAVIAEDKCLHGVAAYRADRSLRHEHYLDVEVIVAFDLSGDDRVREALCRELDRIAADLHCSAVNFTVAARSAEPRSRSRSVLERLGLKLDTAGFVRELPK